MHNIFPIIHIYRQNCTLTYMYIYIYIVHTQDVGTLHLGPSSFTFC